jgi:hypothetical protein
LGRFVNVIELSFVVTPLAGAAGGLLSALKTHAASSIKWGSGLGLLVGIAVSGAAVLLAQRVAPRFTKEVEKRYEWLLLLILFAGPVVLPVAAFALSSVIVPLLLRP